MKKVYFVWAIIIIILATALILRLTSKEDDWLCENGGWIRHGNPSAPMPTEVCPNSKSEPLISDSEQPSQLVGSDRDEHGCIGSAGYSWCELKQKCLRIWEEKCELESATSTENTTAG
jgi:hypothetical protein